MLVNSPEHGDSIWTLVSIITLFTPLSPAVCTGEHPKRPGL